MLPVPHVERDGEGDWAGNLLLLLQTGSLLLLLQTGSLLLLLQTGSLLLLLQTGNLLLLLQTGSLSRLLQAGETTLHLLQQGLLEDAGAGGEVGREEPAD